MARLWAAASIWASGVVLGGAISLMMGIALGAGTVTLAGCLPDWISPGRGGVVIGIGTGLAYGLCNVPAIFEAGWRLCGDE